MGRDTQRRGQPQIYYVQEARVDRVDPHLSAFLFSIAAHGVKFWTRGLRLRIGACEPIRSRHVEVRVPTIGDGHMSFICENVYFSS